MTKPRILVVAEDASLRGRLARWLLASGYSVELAESVRRAREVIDGGDVALVVLVPDELGVADDELAYEFSEPVEHLIVIAAAAAGALSEDDLLVRLKSVLEFTPATPLVAPAGGPSRLQFEDFTLDVAGRSCTDASGQDVTLTRAEFALLLALAGQPNRVLSRDALSRAAAGRGAEPDDRSVDVLISRLRRKIEPDAKTPRIIVTVPGEGYKLVTKTTGVIPAAEAAVALNADAGTRNPAGATTAAATPASASHRRMTRTVAVAIAGATLLVAATLAMRFWYPDFASRQAALTAAPVQNFDAARIPLLGDAARRELDNYATRPAFKALAISAAPRNGWGLAFASPDTDSARKEALERCTARSGQHVCRIYAVGDNVVWSAAALPLPLAADIHAEPLSIPLVAADVPLLNDLRHQEIADHYLPRPNHKALAIGRQRIHWNTGNSREEAARITVERCGDAMQSPCLLLSVDGMLTVQLPQSRAVTDIFMLSTEQDMSEADRTRISPIYAAPDWRAIARSSGGHWYAVGGRASEVAAIDAALADCRAAEKDCTLYAIGNWRVDDKRG
jgi:DNA-binding response OmpR family regulator